MTGIGATLQYLGNPNLSWESCTTCVSVDEEVSDEGDVSITYKNTDTKKVGGKIKIIAYKDGKIVDFTAEKGYETLGKLIATDEGSHYLGEVALVPFKSPISDTNIVFYNTLFDENASCHIADSQEETVLESS